VSVTCDLSPKADSCHLLRHRHKKYQVEEPIDGHKYHQSPAPFFDVVKDEIEALEQKYRTLFYYASYLKDGTSMQEAAEAAIATTGIKACSASVKKWCKDLKNNKSLLRKKTTGY